MSHVSVTAPVLHDIVSPAIDSCPRTFTHPRRLPWRAGRKVGGNHSF
nr:hypothetical protein [Candidatus Sigynarchaeota archaeon]MDO8113356.1 hypothetical protein [Candidatus Sigynarchaeota archaeon]